MRSALGIDRTIKQAWLDLALDQLAEFPAPDDLRAFLGTRLQAELLNEARRARTAGIIVKIWSDIPARVVPLRTDALAILPTITSNERVWLHWGMALVAFPFFRDLAGIIGRLLAHREELSPSQVYERIFRHWEDRAVTRRAVHRTLSTLLDWGVLEQVGARKRYRAATGLSTRSRVLQVWLLEAILRAGPAAQIETRQLRRIPEAFPFALDLKRSDIRRQIRLELRRDESGTERVLFGFHGSLGPFKPRTKKRRSVTSAQPALDGEEAVSRAPDVVPERPLAAPSVECLELFRSGRLYGCIALAHAIIEAMVRGAWQEKMKLRRTRAGTFSDNLKALSSMGLVSTEFKTRLDLLWIERNEFLRTEPTSVSDPARLAAVAKRSLEMLAELERTLCAGSGHFPGMSSQPRDR
jgi:hypothetical protein